jgi:hypothetical protein
MIIRTINEVKEGMNKHLNKLQGNLSKKLNVKKKTMQNTKREFNKDIEIRNSGSENFNKSKDILS